MLIRPLTADDDLLAVSRIYEESWKSAYRGIIPQAYLESISEGRWVNNLKSGGMNTLVMLDEGKYVGTSSFAKSRLNPNESIGEIISIYLLPEYIGKGFGRELFRAAVSALEGMGFRDIVLWVLEENARARAFYERNGFAETKFCQTISIGGKELTELLYRRAKADAI